MVRVYLKGILLMLLLAACGGNRKSEETHVPDSSLLTVSDSSNAGVIDSTTAVADTLQVDAAKLIGKWIQPVAGLDREMQGFQLRKNGSARSINMYTLIYEKWLLSADTLLLWSHSEGVKDTSIVVDTAIIKELSDTTLILYPLKAAVGYTEKYHKTK